MTRTDQPQAEPRKHEKTPVAPTIKTDGAFGKQTKDAYRQFGRHDITQCTFFGDAR